MRIFIRNYLNVSTYIALNLLYVILNLKIRNIYLLPDLCLLRVHGRLLSVSPCLIFASRSV
jgi:hypothetical protein